jgi:dienelactone hydrolase
MPDGMRTLATLAAILLLAWGAFGLLAFALQDRLLFPRHMVGSRPPPVGTLVHFENDGLRLAAVHVEGAPGLPEILAFGGNAWDAGALAEMVHMIAPGHPVTAVHYRGYGPSQGRPSADAILADAVAALRHLHAQSDAPVIALGISIGSGPAAELARHGASGVVLVTPFDTLAAVARDAYPFLPVRALFRHDMRPAEALAGTRVPVALLVAERDHIMRPARSEALRAAIGTPAFERSIAAGHNDIFQHPDFAPALREALATVSPGP